MKEKTHFRSCPKCSKQIGYISAKNIDKAVASATVCRSCSRKGMTHTSESRANMSKAQTGKTLSDEHCDNIRAGNKAYKKSVRDAYTKLYGQKTKRKQYALRKWGKQIQERDDYQCQCCSKEKTTPYNMHAHHIVPREHFPEMALDLSNGITLCFSCHRSLHGDLNRLTMAGIKLDAEGFVAHASNFINPSVPLSSSVLKEDDSNARA